MRNGFQLRLRNELEGLRIQINSDRNRYRLIIADRNGQISRLLRQTERIANRGAEFPWEAVLVGAGGLLIGVIGGFLMGFVTGN